MFADGLADLVKELRDGGTQVVFILDNPRPRGNPVICVGREQAVDPCVATLSEAIEPVAWLVDLGRSLSTEFQLGAPFDVPALLCDGDRCGLDDGEVFFYGDDNHLSIGFTAAHAEELTAWLDSALTPDSSGLL